MSESTKSSRRRSPWWPILGLLLLAAALYFLIGRSDQERPLKPIRATATAVSASVQGQAVSISFPQLNEDPENLRDRRIRVSGSFIGVSASPCPAPKGPNSRWALIADDLQLDAVGYETLLRLVPPGTQLTVAGFWRAYSGPVGCGKNPAIRTVWYLEVDQIIEPNPLLGSVSSEPESLGTDPAGSPDELQPVTPSPTATNETSQSTATPATLVPTPTLTPAATRTPIPTATTDPAAGVTVTPAVTGVTSTPAGSATATAASPATPGGTSSATPTPTATSLIATSQPTQTPLPTALPIATATPGGYPGPASTPVSGSTATPSSYP